MHKFKKLYLLAVIILILIGIVVCKNLINPLSEGKNTTLSYDNQKILIHGLKDTDFEVSIKDLRQLDTVTKRGEATRSNGEEVSLKATGPLLDTFLSKYGKKQKNFTTIRFIAKDNYSIAVPSDILNSRQIIMAYIIDGKPLKEDQPLHIVIPGERAMYWVKMLKQVDFETGENVKSCRKVVFLETASSNMSQEDYKYYDSIDKAIKTKDLIKKYANINDSTVKNVSMVAGDGLRKNETKENFLSAYIKITGKDAPKFMAPQFPQGMHVRDLMFINYGDAAVFSISQGNKVLKQTGIDDIHGIDFSEIIKQVGMTNAKGYKLTNLNGTSIQLTPDELSEGVIYLKEGKTVAFSTGVNGKNNMDNLLSIEAIQ
ncbi:oxidoreductase molybdopterin binding domain protein [Clostridium ragsdalei P11]|uniref:Oxidoreductase molybdopterin binding domain protein n=1 Tax=Clostridium ragsdalei P11 TaxID=1353534 RepID=A0A1A6AL98_9CLOT|nr:molybdopterin-dependent oxidoreductase [Clostridium ragsdalei]OBR90763.1 oxidoreductase molybdopterin binding domain protein [Clostridium ragsdalei P11]